MTAASKPPASRASDRRILIYLIPEVRERLDALAAAAGLTRSQMIARLVERAARAARRRIGPQVAHGIIRDQRPKATKSA